MWTACSLHLGHTVVLMDKWTPEGMLELIDRHRVTTSHMVPTQFHRLLALPEEVRAKYDMSSLRCMVHAAAPCPPEIKRRMIEWWGDAVMEYYAATEGGGTIVTAKEWLERPGTVGKAWAGQRDPHPRRRRQPARRRRDRHRLHVAGAGRLRVQGRPDEDRGQPHATAFFTVGDVGYLDEDGYLFLCDRKIDMIISGGVNIYPAEIEGVFLTHPKVGDVAVFGIPHDDWGEEIKAVIEPAAGVDGRRRRSRPSCGRSPTPSSRRTSGRKTIDFIAEMPRDPNGKLYKRKLRDPYWEGRRPGDLTRDVGRGHDMQVFVRREPTQDAVQRGEARVVEAREMGVGDEGDEVGLVEQRVPRPSRRPGPRPCRR